MICTNLEEAAQWALRVQELTAHSETLINMAAKESSAYDRAALLEGASWVANAASAITQDLHNSIEREIKKEAQINERSN